MEAIQIDNITYLVQRSFIGEKKIPQLLQERLQSASAKTFPLTNPSNPSYNDPGNRFRCEEAQ